MDYSVIQHLRSSNWEDHKTQNSKALVHILPFGIRILLYLEAGMEWVALDEIQFTRELTVGQQLDEFRHFIPESLLSEATILSVSFALESPYFTLLPSELHTPEVAKINLETLAKIPFAYQIFYDKPMENVVLSFAVPQIWLDWAGQVFSNSEINWCCGVSGYLNQILRTESSNETAVYAHIHPKSLTSYGIKNNELQFVNHYPFQTENDLLYYLLLSAQESGVNPEADRCWLSGSILAGSAGYEKLNRYFGNLAFVKNPSVESFFSPNDLLQKPLYFDLVTAYTLQKNA